MANNRDDFKETTKRIMASRVGYICSHPDCNAFTIGPSYEGEEKTSVIGVAAHICAAAPGGKRYDPSMSREERRSINNGIWLCETHARLIDTDETTYTIDVIKEWKRQAEEQASKRLACIDYINNYFNNHGNDISALSEIMKNCIREGNYNILTFVLSNYNSDLGEAYNELVIRYKIFYCSYCDRNNLQKYVDEYIKLSRKDGINELAELFISLNLTAYLKQIINDINKKELKEIAEMIISDQFTDKVFFRLGSDKKPSFKYKGNSDFINKYITYYIYFNNYFHFMDETGKLCELYNDEFFFNCLYNSFEMSRVTLKITDNSLAQYIGFFKSNFDKILLLDIELQELLLDATLRNVIYNRKEFEWFYSRIPEELKSKNIIKEHYYVYCIINKLSINENELICFCESNNSYHSLIQYVVSFKTDKQLEFLNKHQYLYEKNSEFIIIRYNASKIGTKDIINEYRVLYENDFGFNCIDVLEGNTEKIDWLTSNLEKMIIPHCSLYISVLEKNNMFNELINFSNSVKQNNALHNELYKIGLILHNNPSTIQNALEIYVFLEQAGFITKGLSLNIGIIEDRLGKIENAKKHYVKEYKKYRTVNALLYLLNTRYVNEQYIDDEYLEEAKSYKDNADMLRVIGATLAKLNNRNAYKYYLKSLLIDDSNEGCLNSIFMEMNSITSEKEPTSVEENTICYLSNEKESMIIAIHKPEILEGITPDNFANCNHYSSDNPLISDLMYRNVNEKIIIFDNEYTLSKIELLTNFITSISLQSIIKNPSTITLSGSIEESIAELTKYVKADANNLESIINNYNSADMKLPLTTFSKTVGKPRLDTLDFLYHLNKAKILNNTNLLKNSYEKYIFSYEIIVIICKLDIEKKFTDSHYFYCTQQVKDQMTNDIDTELVLLSSSKRNKYLAHKNNKIALVEYDSTFKRERHRYLTKLKKFLNSLNVVENTDYTASFESLNNLFVEEKWLCEGTSLASVKENDNYCLVTDEQFIYNVANLDGSPNIGLCSLLLVLDFTADEFIDIMLKLSKQNYAYYITPELYSRCLELIKNSDHKKSLETKFYDFLISDNNDEPPSQYHSKLILGLFSELHEKNYTFFSINKTIIDITKYHFSLLYPDEYKEIVMEAYRDLFHLNKLNNPKLD